MSNPLLRVEAYLQRLLPSGTSRRKLVQILSVILVVEGLSVVILFSYAALWIGLLSLFVGATLLTLLRSRVAESVAESEPPGTRLIDYLVKLVGGEHVVMIVGAIVVVAVLMYNRFLSARPDLGDVDTISLMFGIMLLLHPVLYNRFKIEMGFALIFVGIVAAFLVLPQVLQLLSDGSSSSAAGDWYVHYMLAAPFSGILDLIGVQSDSSGNVVTVVFQDGSVHALSISAYCAGLYSFSIFVSAFAAFVLVFEDMSKRLLIVVLSLGLMVAYLGNIFRMVVIGLVGYYEGIQALRWAHENVGWVIFLAWSSVFWYMVINYAGKGSTRQDSSLRASED